MKITKKQENAERYVEAHFECVAQIHEFALHIQGDIKVNASRSDCAHVLYAQARRMCYGTQAGGITLRRY